MIYVYRNIFLIKLLTIFLFIIISCKEKEKKGVNQYHTTIEFEKKIYDFGRVITTDTISTRFKFLNIGINPLVIRHVKSSCGCTIPKWPMNPIEIDGTGEIKVIYEADDIGRFKKTINVYYNGEDSPQEIIIKGEVIKEKQ